MGVANIVLGGFTWMVTGSYLIDIGNALNFMGVITMVAPRVFQTDKRS